MNKPPVANLSATCLCSLGDLENSKPERHPGKAPDEFNFHEKVSVSGLFLRGQELVIFHVQVGEINRA